MNDFTFDLLSKTARECGAYQGIAQMMRDQIRKLAESEDVYDTDWAIRTLVSLADQLDDTEKKFAEAS